MASQSSDSAPLVVVLGSANMDVVVRQSRRPEPGETVFGHGYRTEPGGKGLNQAVAAARAGARVEFIGAVGNDDHGRRLLDALAADGIGVSEVSVVAVETGTAHIAVVDSGENSIVVVPGANETLVKLSDAQRELIARSDYLVAQLELPVAVVSEALQIAQSAGVFTVLTPAPVVEFDRSMLGLVDLLVPNEHEARLLSESANPQDAAVTVSRAVRGSVIVTLGGDGVLHARDGQITARNAAHRVEARDTTGAGDTFVGVLVARLAAGDELSTAADAASVGASIAVTRDGGSASMPCWSEIEMRQRALAEQ